MSSDGVVPLRYHGFLVMVFWRHNALYPIRKIILRANFQGLKTERHTNNVSPGKRGTRHVLVTFVLHPRHCGAYERHSASPQASYSGFICSLHPATLHATNSQLLTQHTTPTTLHSLILRHQQPQLYPFHPLTFLPLSPFFLLHTPMLLSSDCRHHYTCFNPWVPLLL
jgi:hypothetical protein